jgi:CheY-like chemotaxis protein
MVSFQLESSSAVTGALNFGLLRNRRVATRVDGVQALQIVQELDGDVDLIVSDVQMPNGDGLRLAQAVKDSYPAIPVVLISGQVKPHGSFEFVQKPFPPATLMKAVRRLFATRFLTVVED